MGGVIIIVIYIRLSIDDSKLMISQLSKYKLNDITIFRNEIEKNIILYIKKTEDISLSISEIDNLTFLV